MTYRYFRIWPLTATNNAFSFAEVTMSESAGGPNVCVPANISAYYDANRWGALIPQNATDGNNSTLWGTVDKTSGYWGVQFSTPRWIYEFSIRARGDAGGWSTQTPETFRFEGSNDGAFYEVVGNFTTAPYASGETKTFFVGVEPPPSAPPSARVHQLAREVLHAGSGEVRAHQLTREVLHAGTSEGRVHQFYREVLRARDGTATMQVHQFYREVLRSRADVPTGETHQGEIGFRLGLGLGLKASAVRQAQVGFNVSLTLGLDGEKDPPFNCQHAEPIEWTRETPAEAVWTAHRPTETTWTKESASETTWTRAPRQTTTWTKQ